MENRKLTMKKEDVQMAIQSHVLRFYKSLNILGKEKPDNIDGVLATIQDREYMGPGKYNVFLEIRGSIPDENGGIFENVPFTTICDVIVKSNNEGSPVIEFKENIILSRKNY